MRIQCKLFKLFDLNEKEIIKKEYQKKYFELYKDIISIEYNMNNYNTLLENFYDYNSKQFILTSKRFFEIITTVLKEESVTIREIRFMENINDEINETIALELNKIYQKKDNNLLKILKIFTISEGIDIKSIKISVKYEKRNFQIVFFNNGVIYTDSIIKEYTHFILEKSIIGGM